MFRNELFFLITYDLKHVLTIEVLHTPTSYHCVTIATVCQNRNMLYNVLVACTEPVYSHQSANAMPLNTTM